MLSVCVHHRQRPSATFIHNMRDKESENAFQARICNWCDTPMPFANQNKNSVCSRCRQILYIAGIADGEIFRHDEKAKKEKGQASREKCLTFFV